MRDDANVRWWKGQATPKEVQETLDFAASLQATVSRFDSLPVSSKVDYERRRARLQQGEGE